MADDTKLVMDCSDPDGVPVEVPLTPEEQALREQAASADAVRRVGVTFEDHEDEERLGLVAERAQTDPAFAALADLALRGRTI